MSALSTALLIFSFQFSVLFFHVGLKALAALRRIGFNTHYRTLSVAKIWISTCLVQNGKWKLDIP